MSVTTIYTTGPACHKCNLTKAALTKGGVEFEEILLTDDPEAAARFAELGFTMAPVVVTEAETWFDFRIDKIRALIQSARAAA